MLIDSLRFGKVEIDAESVLDFNGGLLGFEELNRFAILLFDATEPIQWLQSLEEPGVALPIINPFLIKPEYELDIDDTELESIGQPLVEDIIIVNVMVVPKDITKSTINLSAPIIINMKTRQGRQIIMECSEENPIKYPAFEPLAAYYRSHAGKE